jgi:hypothetical protein
LAKQASQINDLMSSGSAIPWEDRGSVGLIGGFFATAFGMMFKPTQTLAKLRRPETDNDGKLFAAACGGVWFFAVIIQSAFAYFVFYNHDKSLDVDGQQYVINTLLEGVLAGAAAAILPKVVGMMFYRMTSFDMQSKAPPVLVYNVIAYLSAACLLALIPGGPLPWLAIGPVLVSVWMFVTLLIVAIARLRVRVGGAIIGTIITWLATMGMVIAGIWIIQFVWCNLMAKASIMPIVPLSSPHT